MHARAAQLLYRPVLFNFNLACADPAQSQVPELTTGHHHRLETEDFQQYFL